MILNEFQGRLCRLKPLYVRLYSTLIDKWCEAASRGPSALVVFYSTDEYTVTHTDKVTVATDYPTHTSASAGVGKESSKTCLKQRNIKDHPY